MLFEVSNPSDEYTIEAEDWSVACVVGLIIGRGQYGLNEVDGDHEMPLFLFGGLEEWVEAEFEKPLEEFMGSVDKIEVANCLNSIVVGNRANYTLGLGEKTGEEADAFWEVWHDLNCSSMNDIGQYSRNYAAKLLEMEKEKEERHVPVP